MPSIHKAQNTGSKMITQISENLNVHRQYPFISVEWLYVHARAHTHIHGDNKAERQMGILKKKKKTYSQEKNCLIIMFLYVHMFKTYQL